MSRRLKLNVKESIEELRTLLHCEKDVRKRERIHALYLFKTGHAVELKDLGSKLGRHPTTISNWFKAYELVGLEGLLDIGHGGGNPCSLNDTILNALNLEKQSSQGFGSYGEIQQWLKDEYELEIPYHTVYGIVHDKCNAAPKVVRPKSCDQDSDEVADES